MAAGVPPSGRAALSFGGSILPLHKLTGSLQALFSLLLAGAATWQSAPAWCPVHEMLPGQGTRGTKVGGS